MRHFLLSSLVLACAPLLAQESRPTQPPGDEPPVQPPTSLPAEQRIRIGTWNIENFGSRTRGRRSDEDYVKLADLIRDQLKVDLLAVQEINGSQPLVKLCKLLGEDYAFVIGSSGAFRDSPKRISLGFIWNTRRLELLGAEELLAMPDTDENGIYIFHRKPVMASFRAVGGGIDFRAVVVHLKAGRKNRGRRGERDSTKRVAEVSRLGKHLEQLLAREGEDQDLVVLGDFNHDPTYPAHTVFKNWVEYLRPSQHHRSIVHFDEQIDHIAIAPGLREEILRETLTIHSKLANEQPDLWRASYSDHIPLTVELSAVKDNDPDARFSPPGEQNALKANVEPPAERRKPR